MKTKKHSSQLYFLMGAWLSFVALFIAVGALLPVEHDLAHGSPALLYAFAGGDELSRAPEVVPQDEDKLVVADLPDMIPESLLPFWVYGGAFIALLVLIALRELFYAWRSRTDVHDRLPHLFNFFILVLLICTTLYVMQRIDTHRDRFESMFLPYPTATYSAVRQSFQFGNDWVYTTNDTPEAVVAYYQKEATASQYALTVHMEAKTTMLLFKQKGAQLFLAIRTEGDKRVLYYSDNGSVHSAKE